MGERPIAGLARHDERGGAAIEDARGRRRAAVRIEDDPQRAAIRRELRLDGELRVVLEDRTHADEDRVDPAPETVHPLHVFLVAQASPLTVARVRKIRVMENGLALRGSGRGH